MIVNCVGDITGFGKTLEALYTKLPAGEFWALGDIVDRGPNSKLALDFLIDGKHNAVMGNHDHMMLFDNIKHNDNVDWTLYHPSDWFNNGGGATVKSFNNEIDAKYFEFIGNLPLLVYRDGVLQLTHAPLMNNFNDDLYDLEEINNNAFKLRESTLWNRYPPKKIKGLFQLYGHNSSRGILWHTDKNPQGIYSETVPEGAWGACIDTWREGYLTVLSIDTDKLDNPKEAIQIFQHEIIDPGNWKK